MRSLKEAHASSSRLGPGLWLYLAKPGKNVRHVLGVQKPIRNPNMFIGRVCKISWIVDTSGNNWRMRILKKGHMDRFL